jgi:hypothetical protein
LRKQTDRRLRLHVGWQGRPNRRNNDGGLELVFLFDLVLKRLKFFPKSR